MKQRLRFWPANSIKIWSALVALVMVFAVLVPAADAASQPPVPNQFGCTVNEQRVHKAEQNRGEGKIFSKGKSTISCPISLDEISTYTALQRERWYGWQGLDSETSNKANAKSIVDLQTWWKCLGAGTYTYRTLNTHYTSDDGKFSAAFSFEGDSRARYEC